MASVRTAYGAPNDTIPLTHDGGNAVIISYDIGKINSKIGLTYNSLILHSFLSTLNCLSDSVSDVHCTVLDATGREEEERSPDLRPPLGNT